LIRDCQENIVEECDVLPRANLKRKQPKDDKLWPEEVKVTRLYRAGKLKFKRFQSAKDFIEDLHS